MVDIKVHEKRELQGWVRVNEREKRERERGGRGEKGKRWSLPLPPLSLHPLTITPLPMTATQVAMVMGVVKPWRGGE